MSVILENRPIEQVREETIDALIVNYSHGVISAEAFERPLAQAMNTDSHQEIIELVADLTLTTDIDYQDRKEHLFTPSYAPKVADESVLTIIVFSVAINVRASGPFQNRLY